MNETTRLEVALRRLKWQLATAGQAAAQQSVGRERMIREFGLAHPRSIAATRRLNRTLRFYRSLQQSLRHAASDHERNYRRDHPGSWEDQQR